MEVPFRRDLVRTFTYCVSCIRNRSSLVSAARLPTRARPETRSRRSNSSSRERQCQGPGRRASMKLSLSFYPFLSPDHSTTNRPRNLGTGRSSSRPTGHYGKSFSGLETNRISPSTRASVGRRRSKVNVTRLRRSRHSQSVFVCSIPIDGENNRGIWLCRRVVFGCMGSFSGGDRSSELWEIGVVLGSDLVSFF